MSDSITEEKPSDQQVLAGNQDTSNKDAIGSQTKLEKSKGRKTVSQSPSGRKNSESGQNAYIVVVPHPEKSPWGICRDVAKLEKDDASSKHNFVFWVKFGDHGGENISARLTHYHTNLNKLTQPLRITNYEERTKRGVPVDSKLIDLTAINGMLLEENKTEQTTPSIELNDEQESRGRPLERNRANSTISIDSDKPTSNNEFKKPKGKSRSGSRPPDYKPAGIAKCLEHDTMSMLDRPALDLSQKSEWRGFYATDEPSALKLGKALQNLADTLGKTPHSYAQVEEAISAIVTDFPPVRQNHTDDSSKFPIVKLVIHPSIHSTVMKYGFSEAVPDSDPPVRSPNTFFHICVGLAYRKYPAPYQMQTYETTYTPDHSFNAFSAGHHSNGPYALSAAVKHVRDKLTAAHIQFSDYEGGSGDGGLEEEKRTWLKFEIGDDQTQARQSVEKLVNEFGSFWEYHLLENKESIPALSVQNQETNETTETKPKPNTKTKKKKKADRVKEDENSKKVTEDEESKQNTTKNKRSHRTLDEKKEDKQRKAQQSIEDDLIGYSLGVNESDTEETKLEKLDFLEELTKKPKREQGLNNKKKEPQGMEAEDDS